MGDILVLYYSRHGATEALAREVGHLLGFTNAAAHGKVTEDMVRALFEAYATEPYVCPCDAPQE